MISCQGSMPSSTARSSSFISGGRTRLRSGGKRLERTGQLPDEEACLVETALGASVLGVQLLSFLASTLLCSLVKYAEALHEIGVLVYLERVSQVSEQQLVGRELAHVFDLSVARRVDHRAVLEVVEQLLKRYWLRLGHVGCDLVGDWCETAESAQHDRNNVGSMDLGRVVRQTGHGYGGTL